MGECLTPRAREAVLGTPPGARRHYGVRIDSTRMVFGVQRTGDRDVSSLRASADLLRGVHALNGTLRLSWCRFSLAGRSH